MTRTAAVALLFLFAGRLAAQGDQARATISGQVVGPDTVPLGDVSVDIVGSRERKSTGADGRFRFTGIYPGRYEILFRHLGYEQLTRFVTVAAGEVSHRTVVMKPLPQLLQTITISGRHYDVPPKYQEFYRRAAVGFGSYIFPEEVERRQPMDVQSLLQGIPGVRVYHGRRDVVIQMERCVDRLAGPGIAPAARLQVYIDGRRATQSMGAVEALESVHPTRVYAVEVYRGIAQIPGEYLADACGVIAIWTK